MCTIVHIPNRTRTHTVYYNVLFAMYCTHIQRFLGVRLVHKDVADSRNYGDVTRNAAPHTMRKEPRSTQCVRSAGLPCATMRSRSSIFNAVCFNWKIIEYKSRMDQLIAGWKPFNRARTRRKRAIAFRLLRHRQCCKSPFAISVRETLHHYRSTDEPR